jgi:hypothetical protein
VRGVYFAKLKSGEGKGGGKRGEDEENKRQKGRREATHRGLDKGTKVPAAPEGLLHREATLCAELLGPLLVDLRVRVVFTKPPERDNARQNTPFHPNSNSASYTSRTPAPPSAQRLTQSNSVYTANIPRLFSSTPPRPSAAVSTSTLAASVVRPNSVLFATRTTEAEGGCAGT